MDILLAQSARALTHKAICKAISDQIIDAANNLKTHTFIYRDNRLYKFIKNKQELQQEIEKAGYRIIKHNEDVDKGLYFEISWADKEE